MDESNIGNTIDPLFIANCVAQVENCICSFLHGEDIVCAVQTFHAGICSSVTA